MQTKRKLIRFSETGKGQPLIFISGLSVDKNIWNEVIDIIKKNFRIIYFDNKGVGDNNNFPAPLTTLEMAQDVINLIKSLELKKVFLVGHSLGSYVAQHVAALCPVIVEKLILISSRLETSIITRLHYQVVSKLLKANVSREILVEDSLSWLYGSTYLKNLKNTQNLIQEKLSKSPVLSLENFSNQVTASLQHDSREISRKIKATTLVINGDEDILCTSKEAALLAENIENSKLKILENVGHMALLEAPEPLAIMFENFFLDKVPDELHSFS